MSEIGSPPARRARTARATRSRRAAAALRLAGAVRSLCRSRSMTRGAGALLPASQWRLMWWRLRRHRVAVASGALLLAFYATILFSEFLAPYGLDTPPHRLHLRAAAARAHLRRRPPRRALCRRLRLPPRHDQSAARLHARTRTSTSRCASSATATRTCSGASSPAISTWSARREGGQLFLLGTDRLGRDMLSRIIYGARISLTVGLIGVIDQLHARHPDRRHRRLLRRLDRHPDPARHRGRPVLPASAAVDGAVGDPAGDLEPDPRLFRHHPDPRHDRVDASGARRALQAAVAARGGFLHRRGADGREPGADHRPPSAAELYEPPDRLGDPGHPQHDPRRDRAVVPRARPAAADHQLGRAARTRRRTSASSRSIPG